MFRTGDEEAQELAKELRELKDVLREISSKVAQIEARVRRTFPAAFPKAPVAARSLGPKVTDPPSISPEQALKLYDELVALAKQGSKEEAQRRLEAIGLPDLALLSRELGVSLGKSKPSRKVLLNSVLGRISESVMLSTSGFRQRSERPKDESKVGKAKTEQADAPGSMQSSETPSKDNTG